MGHSTYMSRNMSRSAGLGCGKVRRVGMLEGGGVG
jgi:hypothetical protein